MKIIARLLIFPLLSGCVASEEPPLEILPPIETPPEEIAAPKPVITINASHGSIEFNFPPQYLPGNLSINHQVIPATENLTVGFLDPSTSYSWEYEGNKTEAGETSTQPSPFNWSHWAQEPKIYPGVELLSCTLGFIFRDATNDTLYATTAGHCREVGDIVFAYEDFDHLQGISRVGIEVGEVKYQNFNSTLDIAFIEIRETSRPFVSPELKHWTGPTGIELPKDMRNGATVCFYGAGEPDEYEEFKKECGSRTRIPDDPYHQAAYMVAAGGDSGSPVINMETGQAMGSVLAFSPPAIKLGPICYGLQWLASVHGVELQLATAPFSPPAFVAPLPIGGPLSIERETAPCELNGN